MTHLQKMRYLRHWATAFRAHWSGVRDGQPLARAGRPPSELRDEIVAIAGRIAGPTSLSTDHLRHACHVRALGREKSSKRLTNKEQDLVVALFDRLAEAGAELGGQMRLDQRDRELARRESDSPRPPAWNVRRPDADRKRVLWSLEHSPYPEPAIAAIARDRFGTANWRSLDDAALYQLLLTVKRAATRKAVRQPSTPAPEPIPA